MTSVSKEKFTPRASDLEGHELTEHLHNDLRTLELAAAAHEGWENLPAYVRFRYERLRGQAVAETGKAT